MPEDTSIWYNQEVTDIAGLKTDEEKLKAYYSACRKSYLNSPANEKEKEYIGQCSKNFPISSYFEIPDDPANLLSRWGLPEKLRGNIYLDKERQNAVSQIINSSLRENIIILGEPGVGKTALLFQCFDTIMKNGIAGVVITPGFSDFHQKYGIRLFYDDLPENAPPIQAIDEKKVKGLVVTAREQDFKQKLTPAQQRMFTPVYVKRFSDEEIKKVAEKLLGMECINYTPDGISLLIQYAQGSPVYVWSVVRQMVTSGEYMLSNSYLQNNASKGMSQYIGRLLSRLLREGNQYKNGAHHILAALQFLARHTRFKQCPSSYFNTMQDMLEKPVQDVFGTFRDKKLETQVLEYLSGTGTVYKFPHDSWA
ncbi:MAG: hypothetical protein QW728_05345, partial [Thermoplasmata archaeon]